MHASTTNDLIRRAQGTEGEEGWYLVICDVVGNTEAYRTHLAPGVSGQSPAGRPTAAHLVCADPNILLSVPLPTPEGGAGLMVRLDLAVRPEQVKTFFEARFLRPVETLRDWVENEGAPVIRMLWSGQESGPGKPFSPDLDRRAALYGITINAIRVTRQDGTVGGANLPAILESKEQLPVMELFYSGLPSESGPDLHDRALRAELLQLTIAMLEREPDDIDSVRNVIGQINDFLAPSRVAPGVRRRTARRLPPPIGRRESQRLHPMVAPLLMRAGGNPGARRPLVDLLRWSAGTSLLDVKGPSPTVVLDIVGLASSTAGVALDRGMPVVMAPAGMLKRHLWSETVGSSLRQTGVEDLDSDQLPDLVFAMSVAHYHLLAGFLGESARGTSVRDRLRRLHNQAVIAQSWLGAAGEDLQLILISPGGSDRDAEWQRIANEIERDERICRKLVWLPPADPEAHAASRDAFLRRTFLACPWQDCGPPDQRALDWMARLMANVAGGTLDPTVAGRWFELLEQPDVDRDDLVEALVAALERTP